MRREGLQVADKDHRVILVVDDDNAYREAIADLLCSMGYSPLQAHSAKQALSVLETHSPDVVMIDLMMPEIDGLELLRRIKSRPCLLRTPFVVVSALVSDEDRAASWAAGADAFLPKPFTYRELVDIIGHVRPAEGA